MIPQSQASKLHYMVFVNKAGGFQANNSHKVQHLEAASVRKTDRGASTATMKL